MAIFRMGSTSGLTRLHRYCRPFLAKRPSFREVISPIWCALSLAASTYKDEARSILPMRFSVSSKSGKGYSAHKNDSFW